MRILRTAFLAIGLISLTVACGGKDKGASEPAADPAAAPEGEAMPAEGDPANPCATAPEGQPCGTEPTPE